MRALLILVLLAASTAARPATYVVNPFGTGDVPTIQAAILAAADGDTIELEDGVFSGAGNRDISLMGKAVLVRSQNGDPEQCILDAQASFADQHGVFRFVNQEGPNTILEGLTIRGAFKDNECTPPSSPCPEAGKVSARARTIRGPAGGPRNEAQVGAGIYCGDGAGPTIRHCVIADNDAIAGAGASLGLDAYPAFLDCLFLDNRACWDGGALSYEWDSNPSRMTAIRCRFAGNRAGYHGGATALYGPNRFEDCSFVKNCGSSGGSFFHCGTGRSEFLRCTFEDNIGRFGGMGMT